MIAHPRRRWFQRYYPGWIVSGGGGSGGAATVQTDGVTIQGDGSAGNKIAIKQVETNASLTGAGTVPSTLKVTPVTAYLSDCDIADNIGAITANTLIVVGVFIPQPVTFANITVNIRTADGANNCDVGIYSAAGLLLANAGAQHMGSTGLQKFATVQGSQTIQAGTYLIAFTSAASAFAPGGDTFALGLFYSASYGVSAGGALPASITAPTLAASVQNLGFILS